MQRTQIYLTDEEQAAIRQISVRTGASQSALIRTAIDQFISQKNQTQNPAKRMAAFGIWHGNESLPSLELLRGEERFAE